MDNGMEMEERLWSYIDGGGSDEERSAIDRLIRENSAWRAQYAELLELNRLLSADLELEEPPMRFTRNVMEAIAREQIAPSTRNYINKRIIWGIAAFFGVLLVGFLVYAIGMINWAAPAGSSNPLGLELPKTDFSRIWSNDFVNGFLMVNVLLGLLLLERFLARKSRERLERLS
ncbi:hypothetical protein [Flaviaesturariibacter amylovorans]|uniref:Zinc-finger domain-containing protein n=1 Tax=Flaviaesturariibacter amylovorans TaxID=1084520 RepID=A0ABP8GNL3_9BACT